MKNFTSQKQKEDLNFFDSKTVFLQDLELILTQKCNFVCAHCMRGYGQNKDMSSEVMDAVFSKFPIVTNLSLSGGEISLVPEVVNKVYESLVKNKVLISMLNFTTNGTIYNQELVDTLKKIEKYILECRANENMNCSWRDEPISIRISLDDFHLYEIYRQGISFDTVLDNIRKLQDAFGESSVLATYNSNYEIINEGRAKNVKSRTPKIKSNTLPICYLESENAVLIDSIISISTSGEVIPINISYENESVRSFGNITKEKLSNIMQRQKLIKTHSTDELYFVHNKLEEKYLYIPFAHIKRYFDAQKITLQNVIERKLKYENINLKDDNLATPEEKQ